MRRALPVLGLLAALALPPALPSGAQQVVDRIVARIEDDIILLSELRELGAYQQLVEGRETSEERLLDLVIQQWIVKTEATASHYPLPAEGDVDRELEQLEKQVGGPETYRKRLREVGLSPAAVRRMVARQVYLERYLDYKFRPSVQVDPAAIAKYYQEELLPALAARGQAAPPIEAVQDQIHELLTQREISKRAERWLDESRSRLRIEREKPGKES